MHEVPHHQVLGQLVPDSGTAHRPCCTGVHDRPSGVSIVVVALIRDLGVDVQVISVSSTMFASSGTSLIPEAGSLYLLNLGPWEAVLPRVVDRADVEEDVVDPCPCPRRPNAKRLEPGGMNGFPFPFGAPLDLPPFPFPFPLPPPPFFPFSP